MNKKLVSAVAIAALASPAAAQQAPWSEISGVLLKRADPDRDSVLIIAVDGSTNFQGRGGYTHLTPGVHILQLASTRPGKRGEVYYGTFQFDLAPCTRYFLAADHGGSTRAKKWELVIVKEEPIKRCEEMVDADPAEPTQASPASDLTNQPTVTTKSTPLP